MHNNMDEKTETGLLEELIHETKAMRLALDTMVPILLELTQKLEEAAVPLYEVRTTIEGIRDLVFDRIDPDQTKRRPRPQLTMPIELIGLDDNQLPKGWGAKLRTIPNILMKLDFNRKPDCWIFTGKLIQGQILVNHPSTGRRVTLRRFIYEFLVAALPADQRMTAPECDALCVNPLHLRIGDNYEQEADERTLMTVFADQKEKERENDCFVWGRQYPGRYHQRHWDIVYKHEDGKVIQKEEFLEYVVKTNMYHFLDPILKTDHRDPNIPIDTEVMTMREGPNTKDPQTNQMRPLTELLGADPEE